METDGLFTFATTDFEATGFGIVLSAGH